MYRVHLLNVETFIGSSRFQGGQSSINGPFLRRPKKSFHIYGSLTTRVFVNFSQNNKSHLVISGGPCHNQRQSRGGCGT